MSLDQDVGAVRYAMGVCQDKPARRLSVGWFVVERLKDASPFHILRSPLKPFPLGPFPTVLNYWTWVHTRPPAALRTLIQVHSLPHSPVVGDEPCPGALPHLSWAMNPVPVLSLLGWFCQGRMWLGRELTVKT